MISLIAAVAASEIQCYQVIHNQDIYLANENIRSLITSLTDILLTRCSDALVTPHPAASCQADRYYDQSRNLKIFNLPWPWRVESRSLSQLYESHRFIHRSMSPVSVLLRSACADCPRLVTVTNPSTNLARRCLTAAEKPWAILFFVLKITSIVYSGREHVFNNCEKFFGTSSW